jgi:hypothetical protein
MVERDARNVARAFAQLDCPVEVVSDIPPPDGNDGDGTLINFTIGTRDHLNKAEAKASAELWRKAVQRFPKAAFYICLLGYDEDPREIPEIPEAAKYVRKWAHYAGLTDLDTAAGSPIGMAGAAFLAACGAFGEDIQQKVQVTKTPQN